MSRFEEGDMKDLSRWSRREFVQMAGLSLGTMSFGPTLLSRTNSTRERSPRFAYVGFGGNDAEREGIAIFDIRGGQWRQMSVAASRAPSSLTLDANERFLYVTNEIYEHEGLPTGTVEAYAIDSTSGNLTLLNRQRLSLSATAPRHAAVSPDGRALIVSVHGGGAYNVLPLAVDGSLGPVSGILKQTGSGPHQEQRSAHPQMVLFDRAGRIVTADLGSDRLSVFKIDTGRLAVAQRYEAQTGEGPRHLAFHPDAQLLFAANGLEASVASYRYDPDQGKIVMRLEKTSTVNGAGARSTIMAIDPAGNFLYTACEHMSDALSAWKIAPTTGVLRQSQTVNAPQLHAISMTPDGALLLGLSRRDQGVFGWRVANGRLDQPIQLAGLAAPMSLAVKSL
jgi:6-phosphogluconolactonase